MSIVLLVTGSILFYFAWIVYCVRRKYEVILNNHLPTMSKSVAENSHCRIEFKCNILPEAKKDLMHR